MLDQHIKCGITNKENIHIPFMCCCVHNAKKKHTIYLNLTVFLEKINKKYKYKGIFKEIIKKRGVLNAINFKEKTARSDYC